MLSARVRTLLFIGLLSLVVDGLTQGIIQPGGIAPEFKLPDLAGKEFKSSQLKGSVILLDLWATWCEPCVADIPMFNRLFEKYSARGLKIIGVAVQSGWAQDIKPFVVKHRIKYPILVGDESVMEQYDVIGFPTTYLIGRDGRIVKKYIGTLEGTELGKEADLEREIQQLLKLR